MESDLHLVFICKKAANSSTISAVLSYCPATNVTTGYLLSGDGISSMQSMLSSFTEQFALNRHPMIIVLLIVEIMVENIASNL